MLKTRCNSLNIKHVEKYNSLVLNVNVTRLVKLRLAGTQLDSDRVDEWNIEMATKSEKQSGGNAGPGRSDE